MDGKNAGQGGAYVPAKKGFVLAGLCFGLALVLLFALVLRQSLRSTKVLDPSDYWLQTPPGFAYSVTAQPENGAVSIRGWAAVEGERFQSVDCFVVLYDAEKNVYLRVPTVMQLSEEPGAVLGGDINYSFGGFSALVLRAELENALSRYEICFAYRSNEHNALIHTGQYLEEG